MITLEITPELLKPNEVPELKLQQQSEDPGWDKTIVETSSTGEILGSARQKQNPKATVRFFQGKGGFCVVVTQGDAVYFGLPGSEIRLPDTEVSLPGSPIAGKSVFEDTQQAVSSPQQITNQAMILGAGMATRFEPISGDTTGHPKPGVPLVGKDSVISLIAKLLQRHGFDHIFVNTFYKPQSLKTQLSAIPGLKVDFIDEEAPSGTAGGLVKALQQNRVDRSKPIIIIQGDAITDADLSLLMNAHEQNDSAVTIGGQIVSDEDVSKFGMIETDCSGGDQSGQITCFKEKPSLEDAGHCRFANSGFYILSPEVFPLFLETAEKIFAEKSIYDYAHDFFPAVLQAVQSGSITTACGQPLKFWAQAVGGYWSDIGNPTQYLEALRDIYSGKLQIELPKNIEDYHHQGVFYWPEAKAMAQSQGARLNGNIIVAKAY